MWIYEKRLIYPLKKLCPNPRMARLLALLRGGPAGELSASITYLNQRYAMPYERVRAVLTDIGTEEMSHSEMLSVMQTQLLDGATNAQLAASGMDGWVAEHGEGTFPHNWNGNDWSASYIATTGDPIADITHDMGAEERARAGYEGVMRQCDDPDLIGALQFLREREIVHYQRFGECLEYIHSKQGCRKYY